MLKIITIHFENENFNYDSQNKYLHSMDLPSGVLVPNIGDNVLLDDDDSYKNRELDGYSFVITKRIFLYSNPHGCEGCLSVILKVEKSEQD